jgi:DNA-binding NarL/FixJ family response regulator
VDPIIETQLASAGVQGVLSKDISLDDFLWAIDRIAAGYCISRHDGKLVASPELPTAATGPALTNREIEILELIPKGLANKQIAAELDISIKTVEKHRQNLMSKLQAHETAGLTWRAVCLGVDGHSGN